MSEPISAPHSDPMSSPADEAADRLIDAALALAGEAGWLPLSIAEIAGRAGVPLVEAFAVFPTRGAILEAFFARIDRTMLSDTAPDLNEPARDRLFEVIMARFDALSPHRAGMTALVRSLPADPIGALMLAPGFLRRLTQILEAAGLSTAGPLGTLRVQALAVVYADTFRAWLSDDSADLARTMAALDRGLRRLDGLARGLDQLLGRVAPVGGGYRVHAGDGPAAAPPAGAEPTMAGPVGGESPDPSRG